jgi:hypothetical protein
VEIFFGKEKKMKLIPKFLVLLLAVALILGFTGCPDGGGGNGDEFEYPAGFWDNDANATLTVINNTSKDMILSHGQNLSSNAILGGVRAGSTKELNISKAVDDFEIGGYLILRGTTSAEYEANYKNLRNAKVEYSAMATYGQNKKFRIEISPNYIGDYRYRITNLGRIGIELRKGSVDGEKIGYLPALASEFEFYADTSSGFAIFPVYVFFQRSTGLVTPLKPTSHFDTITAAPLPVTSNQVQVYTLPNDPTVTWDSIKRTLVSPVAFVTITNEVYNQSATVTLAGTDKINSQNGFDILGSGLTYTYEIEGTTEGRQRDIVITYYSGATRVPILVDGKAPFYKNGYDYEVRISGSGQQASGYTVTITESAEPRDMSGDIVSL